MPILKINFKKYYFIKNNIYHILKYHRSLFKYIYLCVCERERDREHYFILKCEIACLPLGKL